jgi:hypothetical protein
MEKLIQQKTATELTVGDQDRITGLTFAVNHDLRQVAVDAADHRIDRKDRRRLLV